MNNVSENVNLAEQTLQQLRTRFAEAKGTVRGTLGYFTFVENCIREKSIKEDYVLVTHGEAISEIFKFWCDAKMRAVCFIGAHENRGSTTCFITNDISVLIARHFYQLSGESQLIVSANINFAHLDQWNVSFANFVNMAFSNGNVPLVELLFAMRIDMNRVYDEDKTPLYCAAESGNVQLVTMLLDKGAEINQMSKKDKTPIFVAVSRGHTEVARLLLARGAVIHPTYEGVTSTTTLLGQSLILGSIELNRLVLDRVQVVDTESFCSAIEGKNMEVVQLFLEKNPDLETASRDGTPLLAADSGNLEIFKLLLDRNVDINSRKSKGFTGLYAAVRNGSTEIIHMLLERDAIVDEAVIKKAKAKYGKDSEMVHLLEDKFKSNTVSGQSLMAGV